MDFNLASIVIGISCGLGGAFVTMLITHFRLTTRINENHAQLVHQVENMLETVKVLASNQEKALLQLTETFNNVNLNLQAMQKFLIENEGTHDLIVEKMVGSFDGLRRLMETQTQEHRESIKSLRAEVNNKMSLTEANIRDQIRESHR